MAIIYWIHKQKNEDYLKDGYIGITERSLEERLEEHRKNPPNRHFRFTIKKYGWDNLIKEIIFVGSIEDCLLFENYLRNKEHIGLNHAIGGGLPPSNKGKKHTEETLKKMSEKAKGRIVWNIGKNLTENHKKKIGESNKGRTVSEERRKQISIKLKGNKNSIGSIRTEEAKRKISEYQKDKPRNTTLFIFEKDNTVIKLNGLDFTKYINTNRSSVTKLIKGRLKSLYGWKCLGIFEDN